MSRRKRKTKAERQASNPTGGKASGSLLAPELQARLAHAMNGAGISAKVLRESTGGIKLHALHAISKNGIVQHAEQAAKIQSAMDELGVQLPTAAEPVGAA